MSLPTPGNLMPTAIVDEVLTVLRDAAQGGDRKPAWLTAYQILYRLPAAIQQRLLRERGAMGIGGGSHYAAGNVVADACEMLQRRGQVDISYLDAGQLRVAESADLVTPSYDYCGIYRIRR